MGCKHEVLNFLGFGVRSCVGCGEILVLLDGDGEMFRPEDVERMIAPTPRDVMDEFVRSLKGIAR